MKNIIAALFLLTHIGLALSAQTPDQKSGIAERRQDSMWVEIPIASADSISRSGGQVEVYLVADTTAFVFIGEGCAFTDLFSSKKRGRSNKKQ